MNRPGPIPCPRCMAPMPSDAGFCAECGAPLGRAVHPNPTASSAEAKGVKLGNRTVVGLAAPDFEALARAGVVPASTPTENAPALGKKTVIGLAVSPAAAVADVREQPLAAHPAPPAVAKAPRAARTMMGFSAPATATGPNETPVSPNYADPTANYSAPANFPPPPKPANFPPQPQAANFPAQPTSRRSLENTLVGQTAPSLPEKRPQQRDVAPPPTTAPSRAPVVIKSVRPPAMNPAPVMNRPPAFRPPPVTTSTLPTSPASSGELVAAGIPRRRAGTVAGILLTLVALGALGGSVWWWTHREAKVPTLTTKLTVSGTNESAILEVRCPECPDNTLLQVAGTESKFAVGVLQIAWPEKNLKPGRQNVAATLSLPNGKPRAVTLEVRLPFLIRAGLTEGPIRAFAVDLDLSDDAQKVSIGGTPAAIVNGRAHFELVIPPADGEERLFESSVTYEVNGEGGAVKLAVPYAPLTLVWPTRRAAGLAGHSFILGNTAPGAKIQLTIGTKTLTSEADGAGHFRIVVDGSGLTQIEVVSRTEKVAGAGGELRELAPRRRKGQIEIFSDLEELKKKLLGEAGKIPFSAVVKDPLAHVGKLVGVRIIVAEVRDENGRAQIAGDIACERKPDESRCPVVRVLLPPGISAKKGDAIEVFAVVVGVVGEAKALDLDAAFALSDTAEGAPEKKATVP